MTHDSLTNPAVIPAHHYPVPSNRTPHHRHGEVVCDLRFIAPGAGHVVRLTVRYASGGEHLIVVVPRTHGESWSRMFATSYPVRVLLDHRWRPGLGRLAAAGGPHWYEARRVYETCFPGEASSRTDLFLTVRLVPKSRARGAARPLRGGPRTGEGPWWTW